MEKFVQLGELHKGFTEKVRLNWPLKPEKNVTPKFIASGHISPLRPDSRPIPWVCVKLNEVFLLGGKWLALLLGPAGIGKLPPTPSLIQIRE